MMLACANMLCGVIGLKSSLLTRRSASGACQTFTHGGRHMAAAWQTLEEAALTLGISSRTLHRRLAKGEFETRLSNGRREVFITIDELAVNPTPPADNLADNLDSHAQVATTAADTSDAPQTNHEAALPLSADVQHAVLALHEDRIRRTDLAIMAYQ